MHKTHPYRKQTGRPVTKTKPQKNGEATVRSASKKGNAMRLRKGSRNDLEININPGLRDRIIAELDGSKILEAERLRYLCMMTGRAPQTGRRWWVGDKPGPPD